MLRSLPLALASFAVCALIHAGPALAWGNKGHRIVATVALQELSPEAKKSLSAIMGGTSLADYAVYMDVHKDELEQKVKGSRNWHYDDKPVCESDTRYRQYCVGGHCASTQIRQHYWDLVDVHSPKQARRFAVYVLSHLVGDIHQPLHASDNDDRGGNGIKVLLPSSFPRRETNLHSAWDSAFVDALYGSQSDAAVAKGLRDRYKDKLDDWRRQSHWQWLRESHKLAVDLAYGKLGLNVCGEMGDERVPLSTDYTDAALAVIPEQLTKAGLRLAKLLEHALTQ